MKFIQPPDIVPLQHGAARTTDAPDQLVHPSPLTALVAYWEAAVKIP